MRVHDFDGDGFCVVPIDGVPCLGQRFDRTRHVQKYLGPPNNQKTPLGGGLLIADARSHQRRVTVMNSLPIRYFVLIDYHAYRRCVIGQHTSIGACRLDLDDTHLQAMGQMWVEDLLAE